MTSRLSQEVRGDGKEIDETLTQFSFRLGLFVRALAQLLEGALQPECLLADRPFLGFKQLLQSGNARSQRIHFCRRADRFFRHDRASRLLRHDWDR